MKCPQYIKDMLMSRAHHAERFTSLDVDIQEWLDKHGIVVEEYDIGGGCESYVNPRASSRRIIEAIEEFEPLSIKNAKGYPYEEEEIDESTPVWNEDDDLESLGIGQYRGLED